MKLIYMPARFGVGRFNYKDRNSSKSFLFNILAFLIVISALILIVVSFKEMTAPLSVLKFKQISLDPMNLFDIINTLCDIWNRNKK